MGKNCSVGIKIDIMLFFAQHGTVMELANLLKGIRGKLSQQQVAERAGIHFRTYTRAENGDFIKLETLKKVLSVLKVSEADYVSAMLAWTKLELGERDYNLVVQRIQDSGPHSAIHESLPVAAELQSRILAMKTDIQKQMLIAISRPTVINILAELNDLHDRIEKKRR